MPFIAPVGGRDAVYAIVDIHVNSIRSQVFHRPFCVVHPLVGALACLVRDECEGLGIGEVGMVGALNLEHIHRHDIGCPGCPHLPTEGGLGFYMPYTISTFRYIMFCFKIIDTVERRDVHLAGSDYRGGLVFAHDSEVGRKTILHRVGGLCQQLPCPLFADEGSIAGGGGGVTLRLLVHHIRNSHLSVPRLTIFSNAIEHGLIEHRRL